MSPRTRAATLTAVYYAAVFAALGAHLPYWPVWLESRALGPAEIGWFLSAAMLVRIVAATALPALADRHAIRRGMVAATSLLSAAIALVLAVLPADPMLLLAVSLLWAVAMAPSMPLGEALGLRAATRHGFAYAPIRAAGSIAFLLANLGVGALMARAGPDLVLWAVAGGFAVVALLGLVHPGGGAPAEDRRDRAQPGDLRALLTAPAFLIFAATAAAGQSAHMVYYAYSVLEWQAAGLSGATIGQLWAFGVLVETALMLGPGRTWVARLGAARAMALAGAAGALRWAAMAGTPELPWLWPLQSLHALSFGLGHLAAMAFLAAAIPPRLAGTAQGLSSGIATGGASALVLLSAGQLVEWGGIAAGYVLAAGLALAGGMLAIWLGTAWRGGTVVKE